MKFVLLFSQEHLDFRLAELRGVCHALSIPFDVEAINTKEHIFVLDIPCSEHVQLLLSRSMLLKSAYEFMFLASSVDDLCRQLDENVDSLKEFDKEDESFSVKLRPIGRKKGLDIPGMTKEICAHFPLEIAPVDLNSPKNAFTVLAEYEHEHAPSPQRTLLGRLVGHGRGLLKTKYNLRERCYIGNTTMDPELSFIQANIAAVGPSSLVLDPFVGTGGLILPAAEFGAHVMGTELNYQVARGIGKSSRQGEKFLTDKESIAANFDLYKTRDRLLSVMIADASQHDLWRNGPIFDAIVSDPPYGVREKGRKVGKKERKEHWTLPGCEHPERFPEKQFYSLEATFADLCDLAAKLLVIGGRVSFWFPVILESYSPKCLPSHPALQLTENCEQGLTKKTSRRLLTYCKTREPREGEQTTTAENLFENGTFRDAVFQK